jgi:uncharacterized protein (TIGR03067 family)
MTDKLMLLITLGCLLVAPLNHHKAEEGQKAIEGTWIVVAAELGGRKLPDEGLKETRLVLADGRYTYLTDQGTYKLVPAEGAEAPMAMDIIGTNGPNQGKTLLAIYELAGDTLRICYDLEGKQRPREFATRAGTRQFLATYKRQNGGGRE